MYEIGKNKKKIEDYFILPNYIIFEKKIRDNKLFLEIFALIDILLIYLICKTNIKYINSQLEVLTL